MSFSVAGNDSANMSEVEELLANMRRNERGFYRCRDYLAGKSGEDGIDENWRQRMCEWMYGVVDHCSFRRDLVAVATAYLDICLSKDFDIIHSRRSYQLAAMTALYLAMKVYDTTFVKLDSLTKLGRGLFDEKDVLEMESLMLQKLGWRVHPPTAMCFLRHYSRLIPDTVAASTSFMISEVSRFITEISVCLYKFVKYPPSLIGYAAFSIAMDGIDESSLPVWQRHHIYLRLSNAAGISQYSPEAHHLISKLRSLFEKNVDIRALMSTIDPNCSLPPSSPSKHLLAEGEDSPKDVRRTSN